MSYQNPSTFSPYTPPPDEQKLNRNSVRYASSTTASTSASANPFAGVYRQTEQLPDGQMKINKYETDLPIRVDIEAAMAYAFGCVTGVLLLILEQKNDYVRFHAWQSSILFATIFVKIGLICFLGYQAYKDGDSLERFEMPFFGDLASSWVDNE
ncbi:153_t:CDS:2 [Rhizophagus irregularis]|nr:153_t:CDS:2 [Rhizophagus irregularis]